MVLTFPPRGVDDSGREGGDLAGRVGAVKVVAAPFEDEAAEAGDKGKTRSGAKTASGEETKEAELEKRRQERAAQIEEK